MSNPLEVLHNTVERTGRGKRADENENGFDAAAKWSVYPVLGLVGEAGELAGEVKKIYRNDGGQVTPQRRNKISEELGDILWYIQAVAIAFNLDLADVIQENQTKLFERVRTGEIRERKTNDTIHGDRRGTVYNQCTCSDDPLGI